MPLASKPLFPRFSLPGIILVLLLVLSSRMPVFAQATSGDLVGR